MTILQTLVKADIAIMRVLGGKHGETLSAAAWNAHITQKFFGFTHLIIDLGFYIWERDHCRLDWEYRREIYKPEFTAKELASVAPMRQEYFPLRLDMKPDTETVDDQKQYGSCVAHAGQTAIELMFKRAGKPVDLSRMFLYYHVQREAGTLGTIDGGYTGTLGAIVSNYGVCLESTWGYDADKLGAPPSAVASAEGKALFPNPCTYTQAGDWTNWKRHLCAGKPIVITMKVHADFGNFGTKPWATHRWDTKTQITGLHAVTIIGYDDEAQAFLVENSWSSGWGDGGFFGLPYDMVRQVVTESYVFDNLPVPAVKLGTHIPASMPEIDMSDMTIAAPDVALLRGLLSPVDTYRNVVLKFHDTGTIRIGSGALDIPAYVHLAPFMKDGEKHIGFKEVKLGDTIYRDVIFVNANVEVLSATKVPTV
jgi:hypothetical protein